jgi:predicted lipoprotein with Yx(FWY)xxD motif
MIRQFAVLVAAAGVGLATLAACGGTSTAPSSPNPSSAAPPHTSDLAVAQTGSLGPVVVDARGWTLYRFDRDSATPPASNCSGQCAALWPPAVAGSVTPSAQGIDPSLVGTVMRPGGVEQLTLAGWPLYRYAPDAGPGQTNGQGVNGLWFAVTPQGGKAGVAGQPAPPVMPPSSSPMGGSGY